MAANGQLVFTDVDKVTFKGVGNTSNAVIDTITGKIGVGVDSPDANLHVVGNCFVSTNFELGGTMTMGTVTVRAQHELSAITATGNTTPHTVEFQNAETGLVTTGNVEVGKDLTVTGNVAVDTDTLFVDTVNDRVGIGKSRPEYMLHIEDASNPRIMLENTDTVLSQNQDIGSILFKQNDNTTTGTGIIGKIRMSSVIAPPAGTFYGESANMIFSVGNYANDNANIDALTIRGNGDVGIGTNAPIEKLDVRGAIIAPVVSYSSNQDAPYLIAGTPGYTGAATSWNTHGFQHRIKSDSGGTPRITVDTPSGGEAFSIVNGGNVGIGITTPNAPLDVRGVDNPDMMAMFKTVSAAMKFHTGQGGTSNNWKDTNISLSGGSGGGAILFCFTMNNSSGDRSGAILYFIRKSHTADGTTNGDWNNDSSSVFKISGLSGGGSATSLSFQRNGNKLEYRTADVGNGYFYAIEFD